MKKLNIRLGVGSLSTLLCILGLLLTISFGNRICYGDKILEYVGLPAWSRRDSGMHYTIYYSLLFFIPSFILGYRHKNNIGAKLGKLISFFMIMLIVFVPLLCTPV